MKIGLIGLPNSGKTTVFNALTKAEAIVTDYTNFHKFRLLHIIRCV